MNEKIFGCQGAMPSLAWACRWNRSPSCDYETILADRMGRQHALACVGMAPWLEKSSSTFHFSRHMRRSLVTPTRCLVDGGQMEPDEIREKLAKLHKSAFGWAMVCCGRERELASDILQQAYCRILGCGASFGGRSEFSTWVFGVIRNVAFEQMRRRKRQRLHHVPIPQTHSVADCKQSEIERRELAERLQTALEKLSNRQREVLHLAFYEDMTIEQAAAVLQISVGTARQHYERGKASLRRHFTTNQEFQR